MFPILHAVTVLLLMGQSQFFDQLSVESWFVKTLEFEFILVPITKSTLQCLSKLLVANSGQSTCPLVVYSR